VKTQAKRQTGRLDAYANRPKEIVDKLV